MRCSRRKPRSRDFEGDVLILYGDVPFVPTHTMQSMIDRLNAADAPAVVVLAFEPEDTLKYGRVITEGIV
jgi:bifunctional UDP-N-acetylglucosamine pyrophosphorylase/glucosamine-1-phosphate N-acetyltransferase